MVIGIDGQVTSILPDVLNPFWVYYRYSWWERWVHRIDTDYCRVEVLEEGKHWHVRFEDFDETYGYQRPDYDYNEPILDVIRTNGSLVVTVLSYDVPFGHLVTGDVYYGDTLLFDRVSGGLIPRHIGASKTVEISTLPPVTPVGVLNWFATHKFATGLIIVAGVTGIGLAIKKYWKK